LGPYQGAIIVQVEAQPDISMPDLATRLEEHDGVKADPSNLSKLLCRAGFTFKKRCWHRNANAPMCAGSAMSGANGVMRPLPKERHGYFSCRDIRQTTIRLK
jgi:hypothetical protein